MAKNSDKQKRKINLGLFGFGVVGKGLYDVINQSPSFYAEIKKICVKNPNKKREIPADYFTYDANEVLDDPEIDIVIELTDDAEAAYQITKQSLANKKPVVSANKKMIAAHLAELIKLQKENNTAFLYEGACCASIPIIRNLEEYYDNDYLDAIRGIINGSTNYILTQMQEKNLTYKNALLQAQQNGFAESDPSLDVQGHDAANKLILLLTHAFGIVTTTDKLLYKGIDSITDLDINIAQQRRQKIKLVASVKKLKNGKLAAFVLPQFITNTDELYNVPNEFNALITESHFADKHFFKGKGAGAFPTAAAVLSDISALRYHYKYEYRKLQSEQKNELGTNFYLKIYVAGKGKNFIKNSDFEWLDEVHRDHNTTWAIGTIHAGKLLESGLLTQKDISVIACPGAFAEDVEYRNISGRSLALAGLEL